MPDERRTLMDIWSGGDVKTYKDLPEAKESIIPILEFLTGAEHVPEGEEVSALNIALALPFAVKTGKAAKSLWNIFKKGSKKADHAFGTVGFPSAVLKTIGEDKTERLVTAVEMFDRSGRKVVQPFYKSSGTSGAQRNIREGVWMPFLGTLEKGTTRTPPGFFMKGRQSLQEGGMRLHEEIPSFAKDMPSEYVDYWTRMGSKRMQNISQALSRAEKKGMLKPLKDFRGGMEGRAGMSQYATDIEALLATRPTNPYASPDRFITEKSRLASLKRIKEDPDFNWYREHIEGRLEYIEGEDVVATGGKEVNRFLKEHFGVEDIPQELWKIPY